MSPFGLLGVSVAVVGWLVPGTAAGIALGQRGRSPVAVALLVLGLEGLLGWVTGQAVFGLSAYVLCVGRAARRVDPRVRLLGARLGLQPLVDVEFPLVAPGVFAAASLGFAMQMAARLPPLPAVAVAIVFGLAALGIDLQHREALAEAGALRGSTGPVLLPAFSVAEHLDLLRAGAGRRGDEGATRGEPHPPRATAGRELPAELAGVIQRRPRHLTPAQRRLLEDTLAGGPGDTRPDAPLADQE